MKNFMNHFLDIVGVVFVAGCGALSILSGIVMVKRSVKNSEMLSGLIEEEA